MPVLLTYRATKNMDNNLHLTFENLTIAALPESGGGVSAKQLRSNSPRKIGKYSTTMVKRNFMCGSEMVSSSCMRQVKHA